MSRRPPSGVTSIIIARNLAAISVCKPACGERGDDRCARAPPRLYGAARKSSRAGLQRDEKCGDSKSSCNNVARHLACLARPGEMAFIGNIGPGPMAAFKLILSAEHRPAAAAIGTSRHPPLYVFGRGNLPARAGACMLTLPGAMRRQCWGNRSIS